MSSRHGPPVQRDGGTGAAVANSACFPDRFDIATLPNRVSRIYSSPRERQPRISDDFRYQFRLDRNNKQRERVPMMETMQMDPVLRDCRRRQLALRLMVHQARTQTITALTSLSRHQLATLRQRCRISEQMRHRGPSPPSLDRFTHSLRARSEGATIAAFCRAYRILPMRTASRIARRNRLTLEFGERLCAAYEAFCACFPQSDIAIEEFLSLVLGITGDGEIELGRCCSCNCTVLVDRLAPRRPTCAQCQGILTRRSSPVMNATSRQSSKESWCDNEEHPDWVA